MDTALAFYLKTNLGHERLLLTFELIMYLLFINSFSYIISVEFGLCLQKGLL